MMFNPTAILNAQKDSKMIKGDVNLSVEHFELKQKSIVSEDVTSPMTSPRTQANNPFTRNTTQHMAE